MNRHTIKKWTANATRWLHIYLSMVSFAIVFFFAVTGITLNHADWFTGQQRTSQFRGRMKSNWLGPKVEKLEVVEYLRKTHAVRGAVSDFRVDEAQCSVTLKGPGYSADAFVDRATGAYELTVTAMGLVAILNDLHKGRDTGGAWSWVIDISAWLLVLVSLSGMVLLWFIHRRRVSGYLLAGIGLLISCGVYFAWVP